MATRILVRRDTTAGWIKAGNPVLASGEPGYDVTTGEAFWGDGTTRFDALVKTSIAPAGRHFADVDDETFLFDDATMAALEQNLKPSTASAGAPGAAALHASLKAGTSTALSWIGDSTGDLPADGSGDRLATQLTRQLASRFPRHHVLQKTWSDTAQDFYPWDVLQAAGAGRQHLAMSNGPAIWTPSEPAAVSTGVLDVRALVAADVWASGPGNYGTLVARKYDGNNALLPQFAFHLRDNGFLNLSYATSSVELDQGFASKVAIAPPPAGMPLWLRVTLQIVVGTSVTVSFYSSTDGVAWTAVGTPVVFNDPNVKALNAAPLAAVWVGADGLVQNAFKGKVYEVQVRDGVGGPTIAPSAPHLYAPFDSGSGTARLAGAPTLYMVNASRSGGSLAYFTEATRLRRMTPDYGQELVFFNTSHNDGEASPAKWTTPYRAWVTAVLARLVLASAALVAQNPHDPARWGAEARQGDAYRARVRQVAALAARQGWTLLDLYQAFLDDPRGLQVLLSPDGLHPYPAGYVLGGQKAVALVVGES